MPIDPPVMKPKPPEPRRIPRTEPLAPALERAIAQVEDPPLRDAIARLFTPYL